MSDVPGLSDAFRVQDLDPWTTDGGVSFAVPLVAVSHGILYNKDIFLREDLSIPYTWEDFITLCDTLKARGYTPLANGALDG